MGKKDTRIQELEKKYKMLKTEPARKHAARNGKLLLTKSLTHPDEWDGEYAIGPNIFDEE
jgi:hypothetical protein